MAGGTLAKGRLLGIQFTELFQGDRYYQVGKHSNEMAAMLKKGVLEAGYKLKADSYTNQQFFILPNKVIDEIGKKYRYEFWEKIDEETSAIRLVTSWATKEEDVKDFIEDLKNIK